MFEDGARLKICGFWWMRGTEKAMRPDGITFGANGKAYRGTDIFFLNGVDGRSYIFDESGRMLTGWFDEDGRPLDEDETRWRTACTMRIRTAR